MDCMKQWFTIVYETTERGIIDWKNVSCVPLLNLRLTSVCSVKMSHTTDSVHPV